MIKKIILFAMTYFICSYLNAASYNQENKLILLPLEKMNAWGQPKTLPAGARDYILSGNPGKPELYTFRFELPAHYKISPFILTSTSYVTVMSGKLYVGEGSKLTRTNQHILSAGSYMIIPANVPLYFGTDKKTILQFHGIGPIDVKYVNEQDDPRNKRKNN